MVNQIVTMSHFKRLLGDYQKVWFEIVDSFDERTPISEKGANAWLDRAREDQDLEDKVFCLFMYVMFQIQLDGVAPYSSDALEWLWHGLVAQIGVIQMTDEVESDSEEENSIEERILRGILNPEDVNEYLRACEQEEIADMYTWDD